MNTYTHGRMHTVIFPPQNPCVVLYARPKATMYDTNTALDTEGCRMRAVSSYKYLMNLYTILNSSCGLTCWTSSLLEASEFCIEALSIHISNVRKHTCVCKSEAHTAAVPHTLKETRDALAL